jgi:hypothetical protein
MIAGPDSSSFVEHLRLIYFTLVAASLITIIATTSETPSSAARAYEQTNLLLRVKDRWQHGEWLRAVISQKRDMMNQINAIPTRGVFELSSSSQNRAAQSEATRIAPYTPYSFAVDLTNSWSLANAPLGASAVTTTASIRADMLTIDDRYSEKGRRRAAFETLDDASKIWDRLRLCGRF